MGIGLACLMSTLGFCCDATRRKFQLCRVVLGLEFLCCGICNPGIGSVDFRFRKTQL